MSGNTYYLSQRFNNSPGSATTASAGGTAHFRHGGNINLLFIDGHVESASKARFAEVTKVHCSAAENFWWVQDEKGNLEKLTW